MYTKAKLKSMRKDELIDIIISLENKKVEKATNNRPKREDFSTQFTFNFDAYMNALEEYCNELEGNA